MIISVSVFLLCCHKKKFIAISCFCLLESQKCKASDLTFRLKIKVSVVVFFFFFFFFNLHGGYFCIFFCCAAIKRNYLLLVAFAFWNIPSFFIPFWLKNISECVIRKSQLQLNNLTVLF